MVSKSQLKFAAKILAGPERYDEIENQYQNARLRLEWYLASRDPYNSDPEEEKNYREIRIPTIDGEKYTIPRKGPKIKINYKDEEETGLDIEEDDAERSSQGEIRDKLERGAGHLRQISQELLE